MVTLRDLVSSYVGEFITDGLTQAFFCGLILIFSILTEVWKKPFLSFNFKQKIRKTKDMSIFLLQSSLGQAESHEVDDFLARIFLNLDSVLVSGREPYNLSLKVEITLLKLPQND